MNNLSTLYRLSTYLFLFSLPLLINAQKKTSTSTITLNEVILKSIKTDKSKSILPLSLSFSDLKYQQTFYQKLSLQEYLISVPGLFTQNANNYAQDLRISLRGFGARSAFGIRGIKIIIDGIPETTPDGQGQLDNLPLGILKNFEVLRGPSASLYGNASGGVIYLNTIDKLPNDQDIQFLYRFGDFGFKSYEINTSLKGEKTVAVIHLNRTQTNGFRYNSGFEQNLINTKINHKFNSRSTLQLQINYSNSPRAEDAGGITLENTEIDWRQARQRNIDYDTYESVNQFKTGLRWNQEIGGFWDLESYGFYIYRDFFGKLPFENGGIIDLNRNYYGYGTRLNFQKSNHKFQIGIENKNQKDQRDRYQNLIGNQGDLTFSQLEKFSALGVYLLNELNLGEFLIRTNLRFDNLILGASSVIQDQVYRVLNPSIGISYKLSQNQIMYTNFSTSFETPTLSELSANPSGLEGLNLNLKSSKAENYEVGWKGNWSRFILEANLFYILSSNEILPYELEAFPGRSFYENTGETKRFGFEFFGSYKNNSWEFIASLTEATYQFSGGNIMSKKYLPGVPGSQIYLQVGYFTENNWRIQLTGEHAGSFFANNSNTVQIDSFQKIRVQAAKSFRVNKMKISLSGGINNLLNVRYFDNIRLNAFGGRFYEPAPGRNAYFGINIGI
ncbi:MAG: TonB-dependent receptor family protein [Flavobacteriaceae bacterium]